ncbi:MULTISPECIES: ABC transporter substrate-binding protein [Oceanospirillaceae]|uniref:ABC transporter substrate-binding protein n=1 Tax=Oceanobacter antarcticus TaxID=3133425 RepID=A0ABW8NM29_9GAMM
MPFLHLCLFTLTLLSLGACDQHAPLPLLRIGTNVWPGYEPFYLAREDGLLDTGQLRLVELASAPDVMDAMRQGQLEGAALTLDEVLLLTSEGLDLTVVLICDQSLGADVVLARPEIHSVAELAGLRIGVETSAVGALMLQAALASTQLTLSDITIVNLRQNEYLDALAAGRIDAAVTFAPYSLQLLAAGATPLFSSADIPGQIVDVLAVRTELLATRHTALRGLVNGFLVSKQRIERGDPAALDIINRRLKLPATHIKDAYLGLTMPDQDENLRLLAGPRSRLSRHASDLVKLMQTHHLLKPGSIPTLRTTASLVAENGP